MNGNKINNELVRQLERKLNALENRLHQTHKLEAVGHLAGRIAHDLNNTLTAIVGYSEMARDATPRTSDAARQLSIVVKAANRAKELSSQLLKLGAGKEVSPSRVDLVAVVSATVRLARAAAPPAVDIDEDYEKDIGTVLAYPSEIRQIVMNLCLNAFDAMKKTGGALKVTIKKVEVDPSVKDRRAMPPGFFIRLSVRDEGPGIEASDMERIFEPFFTTKDPAEGSGLGLSVARRIAVRHGGYMTAESERGKGATFHAYFPVAGGEPHNSRV